MYREKLRTLWVILGRIGFILGQKSALKALYYMRMFYLMWFYCIERPKWLYDTSLVCNFIGRLFLPNAYNHMCALAVAYIWLYATANVCRLLAVSSGSAESAAQHSNICLARGVVMFWHVLFLMSCMSNWKSAGHAGAAALRVARRSADWTALRQPNVHFVCVCMKRSQAVQWRQHWEWRNARRTKTSLL